MEKKYRVHLLICAALCLDLVLNDTRPLLDTGIHIDSEAHGGGLFGVQVHAGFS